MPTPYGPVVLPPLETWAAGFTQRSSADGARRALFSSVNSVLEESHGVTGVLGPYTKLGENCSTYAAFISSEAGIAMSGRLGPHLTFLQFEYLGTFEGNPVLVGIAAPGIIQPILTNQQPTQSR